MLNKWKKHHRRRFRARMRHAIFTGSMIRLSGGRLSRLNPGRRFVVNEHWVPIHALPVSMRGMTITHLSDLHVGSLVTPAHLPEIVEAVNRLNSEVIVVTGDMIDLSNEPLQQIVERMQELSAPGGVYFVMGNHDYLDDGAAVKRAFAEAGLNMLNDEVVCLKRAVISNNGQVGDSGDAGILGNTPGAGDIQGVGDSRTVPLVSYQRIEPSDAGQVPKVSTSEKEEASVVAGDEGEGGVGGEVLIEIGGIDWASKKQQRAKAVAKLFRDDQANGLRILLSHHPDTFDAAVMFGVDLTLAGHTHGGQMAWRYGRFWGKNPNAHIGMGHLMHRYTRGLYRKQKGTENSGVPGVPGIPGVPGGAEGALFVSTGVGSWFPFRVGCPAEITQLTLVDDAGR